MSTKPYINIHTHHPTGLPDHLEIENLRHTQIASGKARFCSAGLHPWFLSEIDIERASEWLRDQAVLPNIIAIGEGGLDKVTDTPRQLQLQAFQYCMEISEASQKPLVIHCVRAFNEIIALKKKWKPVQPWIFHGFDKNQKTAEMLLLEGCFLSFGKALFHAKSHAAAVLCQTPADRFFLETDDVDFPIEEIYRRAATLCGVSLETLLTVQEENFRRQFL